MKYIFYFLCYNLIIFCAYFESNAQNSPKTDSLKLVLNSSKEDSNKVNILNTLSGEYINYDFQIALKYGFEGVELAQKINFINGLAKCYNRIGAIYYYHGNLPIAIEYYRKTLSIYEEINDLKGITNCMLNIGALYYRQNENDKSLLFLKKSLYLAKQQNDSMSISRSMLNMASVYVSKNKADSALFYLYQSLAINISLKNQINIAKCYTNIGKVLIEKDRFSDADKNFSKALTIFREKNDLYDQAIVYNGLGELNYRKEDFKNSISYFTQAIAIAKKINSSGLLQFHYNGMSKSYAKTMNFKKAYEYSILYQQIKDSIYNKDNIKSITQIEMEYTFNKRLEDIKSQEKQKEIAEKANIERQKLLRNIFFTGFFIILLIVISIFRNYRLKNKLNKLLKEQKQEIYKQKELILLKNSELNQQKEEIMVQKEMMVKTNHDLGLKNTYLSKSSSFHHDTNTSVIMADEKGNIEWINNDFIKIYGITKEEYISHDKSIIDQQETMDKLLNGKCHTLLYEYKSDSNNLIKLKRTLTPVFGNDHRLLKIIVTETEILPAFIYPN